MSRAFQYRSGSAWSMARTCVLRRSAVLVRRSRNVIREGAAGRKLFAAFRRPWKAALWVGPSVEARVSRSSILNVTFDCSDAESMARFWSEVTCWPRSKVEMPGNPFWWVGADGDASLHLVFVEVPEPKRTKNRVHLDLLPQDGPQDQEIARLESLGARIVDDRRGVKPGGWVVMADLEGNEFCVEDGE